MNITQVTLHSNSL